MGGIAKPGICIAPGTMGAGGGPDGIAGTCARASRKAEPLSICVNSLGPDGAAGVATEVEGTAKMFVALPGMPELPGSAEAGGGVGGVEGPSKVCINRVKLPGPASPSLVALKP